MMDPALPPEPVGVTTALSAGARAVDDLLSASHLLAAHELPDLLAEHGRRLGVRDVLVYLVDLQQQVLVPFVGPGGPGDGETVGTVVIDATLAGRAYQHVQVLEQDLPGGRRRIWLPLRDGSERLGVLSVVLPDAAAADST